jgi:hypothetical protein
MVTRRTRTTEAPPPLRRTCGAMQVYHQLMESHPAFRAQQLTLEHATTTANRSGPVARAAPFKIAVVVHVVYASAKENISVAQIKSQITALNKDYRAKNTDRSRTPAPWKGLVADAHIQFHLATKGPDGKTSKGITRTKTTRTAFVADDDSIKSTATGGVAPWPTDEYLNIWVCGSLQDARGNALLGYAQFPGGPAATDGVVIWNGSFGTKGTAKTPFNLGRTATHEIGHFLNLRHIWGDAPNCAGDDLVADTPPAEDANFNKPTFPHVSCSNGPNGDMFVNYMDYVDDDTMFMFTTGQVARMHAALNGIRSTLVT